jgi:hypothetical protein
MITIPLAAVAAIADVRAPEFPSSPPQQSLPRAPGQAAYAAIGEIVRILQADSTTDWSRVNIEALRQHLIDMDDVTMRAAVSQRDVAGGLAVDVTGAGRVADAIRRMTSMHAMMLDGSDGSRATVTDIAGGARIVFTATDPTNARRVAEIRGLGFAGMMTVGEHHARHHLALARGEGMGHGG